MFSISNMFSISYIILHEILRDNVEVLNENCNGRKFFKKRTKKMITDTTDNATGFIIALLINPLRSRTARTLRE